MPTCYNRLLNFIRPFTYARIPDWCILYNTVHTTVWCCTEHYIPYIGSANCQPSLYHCIVNAPRSLLCLFSFPYIVIQTCFTANLSVYPIAETSLSFSLVTITHLHDFHNEALFCSLFCLYRVKVINQMSTFAQKQPFEMKAQDDKSR